MNGNASPASRKCGDAPDPSDAELLRRFAAGDQQAAEAACRRFLSQLKEYVQGRFSSLGRHRGEDVVGEAMLQAWRSHERLCAANNLSAYLTSIARNVVLREFRNRRPIEMELAPNTAGPGPSPSETLEWKELAANVSAALNSLPESHRRALELRWQGYSHREIGKRLGCTPNAARILTQKGRKGLGRKLSHCGDHCAIDAGHPDRCPAHKDNLHCPKYDSKKQL